MRYLDQSHIDTVVTMAPPKRTAEMRKSNLAKAREMLQPPATQYDDSDLASILLISQENLANAKTQVTSLELAVENLQATCARLLKDLDAAK